MNPQAIAQGLLNERGMTGDLHQVGGIWQFRGLRGSQGAAVEIDGDPDLAILTEVADIIASELIGR